MTKNLKNKTEKRKIGDIGENLACRFLESKGYKIIGRNYLKPYGEIDIVAKKGRETIFIEVKSVTRHFEAKKSGQARAGSFSHETSESSLEEYDHSGTRVTDGGYRPEDNLHPWKLKRLTRAINSYLVEKNIGEGDWRFDIITVYLNPETKKAKVEHLEGIVL